MKKQGKATGGVVDCISMLQPLFEWGSISSPIFFFSAGSPRLALRGGMGCEKMM